MGIPPPGLLRLPDPPPPHRQGLAQLGQTERAALWDCILWAGLESTGDPMDHLGPTPQARNAQGLTGLTIIDASESVTFSF